MEPNGKNIEEDLRISPEDLEPKENLVAFFALLLEVDKRINGKEKL